ncbi:MAG: formate C-acetyltransferase/glycerol dehydratase family glycyl radical enzyme [Candidatus Aminicenantes bacterium]|nr:formate C-acetyltransferase/glycerol dehydratase family glycyl radical enzyme [Candidatus Aminicenantes bacterium]
MEERIKKLRKQTISAKPTLSSERAVLITEFYKSALANQVSAPVRRALAFKYLLEKKKISINEGELIVGERGPAPKATPTYPEITTHSLIDLKTLNSRQKTSFSVSEKIKKLYQEEIIPFWKGKSIRDRIFAEMSPEWKDAYEAGVFTEFMEQRAPGHTVLDDKIYKKGFLDFKEDIKRNLKKLDFQEDPEAYEKREQLRAMEIAAEALILFAERHAQKARALAKREKNQKRKEELRRIAEICSRVPAHAPRDFWEALQYYWFVHLGVITELNGWDAFNPGRLDQHLYPFYKKGLKQGTLTKEKAKELLQAFWIKFNNQPAPPKIGVTAEESSTYTDFALINTGGVKADGSNGVNELSYLILDVIEEMRILQPSSAVQISQKTPHSFLKRALKIIKTGFGQPSIFNTDVIVQELVRQGKSIQDARNGGTSGCVETGAFGKENYNLTGYFNLTKVLEITLNNGKDPRTRKKIGLETGDPARFSTFNQLFEAFKKQVNHFVDIKIKGNNIIERLYAEHIPAPFLSLLINDCIAKGKDYHDGGARYNTSYIQGVGMGTMTDALTAIKYNVYDKKIITMKDMLKALQENFKGQEIIRQRLLNKTPKYGNDDDYADEIMKSIFETYFKAVDGRPNTKGGTYRINLLPTTVHIYFGRVVGATPDGRKASEPLSEGVSPVQGADRNGPTAVIKSVAKMDHIRTGGTLLNQKFTPHLLADEERMDKLAHLIRSYFKLEGHHIQLNVVDAQTLRAAQRNPEKYRDLIVRVAGYSDYFCDLNKDLQDEIISRTEHQAF